MKQRGVSLIELIVVIVALTAGMAILGGAFIVPARSVGETRNAQLAWQVAQACADHVFGRAREPGQYANVALGTSNMTFGANTCSITVGDGCPGICADRANCLGTTFTCRPVAVSSTISGYTATVNLALFNY